VALSLQRIDRSGVIVKKVKIFARYSVPLVWGIVGLIVGCIGAYFGLAFIWMHVIMRPQDITPTDGLTVIILSLVTGVFIGSASLYASAQTRWAGIGNRGQKSEPDRPRRLRPAADALSTEV
jgi:hypothetical protein